MSVYKKEKKQSINILNGVPDNNKAERYKWQFILQTKTKEFEEGLRVKNISLVAEQEKQLYIATAGLDNSKLKEDILKTFDDLATGIIVVRLDSNHSLSIDKTNCNQTDFRFYGTGNSSDVYVVGENDTVKRVIQEMDRTAKHASEQDMDNSWERVDFFEIRLSQNEQATMYLYKLWELPCLKSNVRVDKEPKYFRIQIGVPVANVSQKTDIEVELKKVIQSKNTYIRKCSFNSREVQFLNKDPVFEYINTKLNYSSSSLICAWYIVPVENNVVLYSTTESQVNFCKGTLERVLKTGSMKFPLIYFKTDEIQQTLSALEKKYENRAAIWMSESLTTLNFLSVTDNFYNVEKEFKSLFTKRVVTIDREKDTFCKKQFLHEQNRIEERYHVKMSEEGDNIYTWIIEGVEVNVNEAVKAVKTVVESVYATSKCYKSDVGFNDMQKQIHEEITTSCLVKVENAMYATPTVDLCDQVLCRRWQLPNGNDIKIVNADHSWLLQRSVQIQITEATELNKHFNFDPYKKTITIYLPKWMENANKEKEMLKSNLDMLYQAKLVEGRNALFSVVIFSTEPKRLGWPCGMFMKELLLALGRNNVEFPLIVLEPSRQLFDKMSNYIEKYAIFCRDKICIKVKTGELAKEQCDAVVNSTDKDLNLKHGAVSATILTAAGEDIQTACDKIMSQRPQKCIQLPEVVVTKGYYLPCRFVFHGALTSYWQTQIFGKFVFNCLQEAENLQLRNIAFPALGTGKLSYPVDEVAKTMFRIVNKFSAVKKDGYLKEVLFVIYEKDRKSLEAFQREEDMQKKAFQKKESFEVCSNPFPVKVKVIGKDRNEVDQTFRQIEEGIKAKQQRKRYPPQEPDKQDMSRESDPVDTVNENIEYNSNNEQTGLGKQYREERETEMPTSLHHSLNYKEQDESEIWEDGCCLKIEWTNSSREGTLHDFTSRLKKAGIDEKCIIWCHYMPNEARLKLPKDVDPNAIISEMTSDELYRVFKCDVEAVVNIQAKLNKSMNKFLEIKSYWTELEKESGAKISVDEDKVYTLAGSLTDISVARFILMKWKDEPYHLLPELPKDKIFLAQNENKIQSMSNTSARHLTKSNIEQDDKEHMEERKVLVQNNGDLKVHFAVASQSFNAHEKADVHVDNMGHEEANGSKNKIVYNNTEGHKLNIATGNGSPHKKENMYPKLSSDNFDEWQMKPESKTLKEVPQFTTVTDSFLVMTTKEGLKIFVYPGNICYLNVDCIVNSSNERMNHSSGLAQVIASEAGNQMEKECQRFIEKYGNLSLTSTCVTTAGNLSHYRYILHVCSPEWSKKSSLDAFINELTEVVESSLIEANSRKLKSIAIPAIGSGRRGGPQHICFPTYLKGATKFSHKHGGKSSLKEIHFVDRDEQVVSMIEAAFLVNTPKDKRIKERLKKIPKKVVETVVSMFGTDDSCGTLQSFQYANNVKLTICDGALFSGFKHSHLTPREIFEDRAVVITQNKTFNSKSSKSTSICFKRVSSEFLQKYNSVLSLEKAVGKVYHTLGDACLNFGYVLFAIMPERGQLALVRNSSEQFKVFKCISQCFSNCLKKADKLKIKHLCLPFLCEDFYDFPETWFLETCLSDMMAEMNKFTADRKNQHELFIHITTRKDPNLQQIITANFEKPDKTSTGKQTGGKKSKENKNFGSLV